MMRATILIVITISATLCGIAQDRALISGDTEDKQDVPVAGVHVTLQNPSLGVERNTTTNADGYYFFAEVAPAEGYVVTASLPGMAFAPQTVKFDIEVGETRHVLPSFVGDKTNSAASGMQRFDTGDWDYWFQASGRRSSRLSTKPVSFHSSFPPQLELCRAGRFPELSAGIRRSETDSVAIVTSTDSVSGNQSASVASTGFMSAIAGN
jgi:hypothetical protein